MTSFAGNRLRLQKTDALVCFVCGVFALSESPVRTYGMFGHTVWLFCMAAFSFSFGFSIYALRLLFVAAFRTW